MARKAIVRYILQRHAGELEPSDSLFEPRQRPKGGASKSAKQRPAAHLLCPDRETLDRFLAGMLNFISPQYLDFAATLELVPAWLRFIETRGLLTAEQRATALNDLRKLVSDAAPIWAQYSSDPTFGPSVELAWERA